MNKVTSCCKATYTKQSGYYQAGNITMGGKEEYMCDTCNFICTLEDTPAHTESWEDRFDKQFMYVYADYIEFDKHTYWDIRNFIKSELERRDMELIEKIDSKIRHMIKYDEQDDVYIGKINAYQDIINLIKNK